MLVTFIRTQVWNLIKTVSTCFERKLKLWLQVNLNQLTDNLLLPKFKEFCLLGSHCSFIVPFVQFYTVFLHRTIIIFKVFLQFSKRWKMIWVIILLNLWKLILSVLILSHRFKRVKNCICKIVINKKDTCC